MWDSNTTPEHMAEVLVTYIPKHSRPSLEISEYRPISLISCLGKLYTMVWLPSLIDKLQLHITKHQGAFQKGMGALEQAWLATQLLQERREQRVETHAALTNLEKCYDTVWREGLYFLLYNYGVQGDMLRNIKSWIENTRVIPEWNGIVGKGITPREGLKQGCCLSPTLFAAFMNAFTARVRHRESATPPSPVCAKGPSERESRAKTGASSQPPYRARSGASNSLMTSPCLPTASKK